MKKTRLLQTNRKALAGGEVREAKTGEFNPLSPKSDQYPVADLDFQIRGRENKNNGGGGRALRAPTLDPPLISIFS